MLKASLSAPEEQGYIGAEEKLFFIIQGHLRNFIGIELSVESYFDGSNSFIESSIIETHGSFHMRTGPYFQIFPAHGKSRGALLDITAVDNQWICFTNALTEVILHIDIIRFYQSGAYSGAINGHYANTILVSFSTNNALLAHTD